MRTKLEFNVMTEEIDFPRNKIPGEIHRYLSMEKDRVHYKRILFISELNFRTDEIKEIEKGQNVQEITIRYRPVGIGKMRLMVNMERSLRGFTDMGFEEKDIDDVKVKWFII